MSDLDDFDLKPKESPDDSPPLYRPEPEPEKKPGGLLFPAILALGAIAAIGLLAVLYMTFRTPVEPEPEAAPPPLTVATPTPAPTATPVVLPALDQSDDLVRQLVSAISTNSELGRWIAQTELVRTLTVATVNVATGESPRPHLLFLEPKTRFVPTRVGRSLVPDPASFLGYDVMADAVTSLDAGAAAATYRTLEPLFDVAFEDFGMPDMRFRTILKQAVGNLRAVPDLPKEVELVPHATTFRYGNPKYEKLTPAQKQFLRTGPRNVKVLKTWLGEFAAALDEPAADAPPETP